MLYTRSKSKTTATSRRNKRATEQVARDSSKVWRTPTDSKASLDTPKPPATELMKKTIKDTVKSVTGDADNPLPEEMELIRTKEDAILENAEIIGYKMVMQLAQRAGAQETIPVLEQSIKEEQSMVNWIIDNTPVMLDKLWPKIQAAITK